MHVLTVSCVALGLCSLFIFISINSYETKNSLIVSWLTNYPYKRAKTFSLLYDINIKIVCRIFYHMQIFFNQYANINECDLYDV